MEKEYETPKAEEIRISLEATLLYTSGGQDPFEEEDE